MKNIIRIFVLLVVYTITTRAYEYQSQGGQDQFIHETFFKDKKNGLFLDIGAHDGKTFSNTYFFEKELDWTGICFEPLPHLFKQLAACRTSICINACVADRNELMPFLQVEGCDEMLSGLCGTYDKRSLAAVIADIQNFGGACQIINVPCVTLSQVLKEHAMSHIDFLSLDTEGSELEILKTIDFDSISIDVITVENNYNEPLIRYYLELKGYVFIKHLHVDDVYAHKNFLAQNAVIASAF